MWRHSESEIKTPKSPEATLRTVQQLRGEIRQVETCRRNDDGTVISTGALALDQLLPSQGYHRGTVIEWLADRGSGADYLSLLGARNAAAEGGGLVIVDGQGEFYPPAARALGIKLSNLIVLRPNGQGPGHWLPPARSQSAHSPAAHSRSPERSQPNDGLQKELILGERVLDNDDLCWAIDQSLRCNAVAAVWGALPEFESLHAERTWLRRFQLSAETSGCTGFFIRPTKQAHSSWAEIQWRIQPRPSTVDGRRIGVTLLRCQGGLAGQTVELEINTSTGNVQEYEPQDKRETQKQGKQGEPTHSMPLAAKLAHPATRRRSARA